MVVDNLFLNGTALNDSSAATNVTGDFAVDYLRISDVSKPFTLTGTSTMSWAEEIDKPLRSALAYQIKVVNIEETQSVPEPTLALGLTVGALAMTRLRRTRSITMFIYLLSFYKLGFLKQPSFQGAYSPQCTINFRLKKLGLVYKFYF